MGTAQIELLAGTPSSLSEGEIGICGLSFLLIALKGMLVFIHPAAGVDGCAAVSYRLVHFGVERALCCLMIPLMRRLTFGAYIVLVCFAIVCKPVCVCVVSRVCACVGV